MKLAGKTDIGMVRPTNQDTFCIESIGENLGLALVCDGMGGVRGGDRASAIARRRIVSVIKELCTAADLSADRLRDIPLRAIYEANKAVFQASREYPDYAGMGTTAVLCLIMSDYIYVAHVGDSRLYLLRNGQFFQVTKDHSRVQEMVDAGEITAAEARIHPNRNIITRAVGVAPDVNVDLLDFQLYPGDRLLLCSDGLSGPCTDQQIAQVVSSMSAEQAVETLISLANKSGGYDNITAVVAEI